MKKRFFIVFLAVLLVSGCTGAGAESAVLRLATTTSTYNSGLLDAILPQFESQFNVRIDVIAVGTGQAIKLGESGDADVILVHARSREDQFLAEGHGTDRFDVMFNDFVLVGPGSDPAGISGMPLASDALQAIAAAEAAFASRGDDSGTHIKEKELWQQAGFIEYPPGDWYLSVGQGMGDTLRFANETLAYTMTDRGTFLALKENLPDLVVHVGGASIDENQDGTLFNPYGVIPVDPNKGVNHELALQFADWLTSEAAQQAISEFGMDKFEQPLFYPNAE
ncbi:MAG: substrate-binding domain-containing protein [Anaerolineae bacterium]